MRHVATVERLLTLPPGAFRPPPKVHRPSSGSASTRRNRRSPTRRLRRARAGDLHSQRRKTLANALQARSIEPTALRLALPPAGLDGRRRPETLSVAEFARARRCFARRSLSCAIVSAVTRSACPMCFRRSQQPDRRSARQPAPTLRRAQRLTERGARLRCPVRSAGNVGATSGSARVPHARSRSARRARRVRHEHAGAHRGATRRSSSTPASCSRTPICSASI